VFLSGRPFPYILRESEFYQHRFFVNENVLVPRPETELLVDTIIRQRKKFSHVLDVGTGSGVILLSLIKAGIAEKGVGCDISDEALKVAAINQQRLRLQSKTKLLKSDRLKNVTDKFDLIVSNPPYIKAKDHRSLVQGSVDAHEPHLALYLDDATYDLWFQDFFQGVRAHLNPAGQFWMEGHEKELTGQKKVLQELGFQNVMILKDYSGLDRFLSATSPV
jgi:release factor glutamine methyltransferase